ncbi:Zinc finger RING-type domain containing protein [Klebsormidium nitens]|uniref:Zinc finger RING-type domain containing protein n=1 Tax=Klebsormidium nitens TaxID=105231 RepID=A0A1Y1I6G3_KLENI|nr:Zinc finger RING-type domain containing protein [Klebsormidium nitens]|eukprot:GAQ85542.1 Zinc finger RING-type domain containing protein [Klebsormidium nitens]
MVPGTPVSQTPALAQHLGVAEASTASAPNGGDSGSDRVGNNGRPSPLPGAAHGTGPSHVPGSSDTWEDVPLSLLRLESREQELNTQASKIRFGNFPAEVARNSTSDHLLSAILPTLLPRAGGVPNGSSTGAEGASSSGTNFLSVDAAAATLGPRTVNGYASQTPAGGVDGRNTGLKGKTKVAPVDEGLEGTDLFEGSSCCICFEKPKDAAFVPCGHRVCYGCGGVVHKQRGACPMCNKKIDIVLRLFG